MRYGKTKQERRKRSKITALIMAAGMCLLAGCGAKLQLPENPIVYQREVGEEYVYLTEGDRIYVPYCPYETRLLGECIGYSDIEHTESGEMTREYICELKGYPSDQWLVSILDTGIHREGMIMRELNATEIPEGLSSEYEWNQ